MALQVNTAKITGTPSENGWSQSYECAVRRNGMTEPQALLVVFSTIRNGTSSEDAELGKKLLQVFQNEYFSNPSKTSDVSLKDAVKKVFNEFFQKMDGLEISAASYYNGRLFTSCINGGKAALFRDRFLVKILDSRSPQLISASGYPKIGDIVILATSNAYDHLAFRDIKDTFSKGLSDAEDYVSSKVHNVPTASMALMSFSEKDETPSEEKAVGEYRGEIFQKVKKPKLSFILPKDILNRFRDRLQSLPKKRIYIKSDEEPVFREVKNKNTFYVGIFLVFILAVSVVFGVMKNKDEEYKKSYENELNRATSALSDAINLKDVDVKRARDQFLIGRQLVLELQKREIKDESIDKLAILISENEKEVLGEKKTEPVMWLDLTLIKDGFNSKTLTIFEDVVYAADLSQRIIIPVQTDTKKSETIKIPEEIENVKKVVVNPDEVFLLTGDGIFTLTGKKKVVEKNWADSEFLVAFASNLYLLDESRGEILKSSGVEEGFSETKKWTTSESEDFSEVRSFAVDGFAWVLTSGGVNKYSYGNDLRFELSSYPYEVPGYDRLYTDENSADLYLLDNEGKIISVFDKEGIYKYNLISDVFGEAVDFVVSESEGKIILLTGEKLYEVKI